MKPHHLIGSALLLLLSAFATHAMPVTWQTSGVITDAALPFFFPFSTSVGQTITFSYTLDTAASCTLCSENGNDYENVLDGLVIGIGGNSFQMPVDRSLIMIRNDEAIQAGFLDSFLLLFGGIDPLSGVFFGGDLVLQNVAASPPVGPLSSALLSSFSGPPDPEGFPFSPDFSSNFFNMSASFEAGFNSFGGHLVSSVGVPEPGTLTLLFLAAFALIFMRARRFRAR